jgi:hypothetical protein
MASLTALLMSSRSMVASLKMVPPEGPLVYRKIPRLYRGCAPHATEATRKPADKARNGRRPLNWLSRAGPIRVDLAKKRGACGTGGQICGKRM